MDHIIRMATAAHQAGILYSAKPLYTQHVPAKPLKIKMAGSTAESIDAKMDYKVCLGQ